MPSLPLRTANVHLIDNLSVTVKLRNDEFFHFGRKEDGKPEVNRRLFVP